MSVLSQLQAALRPSVPTYALGHHEDDLYSAQVYVYDGLTSRLTFRCAVTTSVARSMVLGAQWYTDMEGVQVTAEDYLSTLDHIDSDQAMLAQG